MILDGRTAAEKLFEALQPKAKNIKKKLCAIQVGSDPASTLYINLKRKKTEQLGLIFEHVILDESVSQEEAKQNIQKVARDVSVGGMIVQLPLPEHLNRQELLDLIPIDKDIDCLSSGGLGAFFTGASQIIPATPYGVLKLLDFYNIAIEGKDVCIIGASNLIGKPLSLALTDIGATVTLCHIKTQNLKEQTRESDIVISAVGKAHIFGSEYFKPGQTVIDIGVSKSTEGRMVGDIQFDEVSTIVENITPSPGGVGPMTIYALVENFVLLYFEA